MDAPFLAVSHNIFLTEEQRYLINKEGSELTIIGCCTPVWIKKEEHLSDTPEEIFVNYHIKHMDKPEKQTIVPVPDGFNINLSPEMPIYLKNIKDGGCMSLILTHRNAYKVKDKYYSIIHSMSIEDIAVLEKTLC